MEDPFVSSPDGPAGTREPHRYSSFDTQLFSLNAPSPSQAKRALEAHLAETERRLQEASKLGTALVNQQKELTDKLQELDQQRDEGEISPELRQKLVELEKEYNEIGRESARAFLAPKRAVSGGENTPGIDPRVRVISSILKSI
jgi:DNA repair exonuclease SbcCD ATPase subunit